MVKIIIGNVYSKIAGHLPPAVTEELYKTLAYKVPGARHMPLVKKRQWDGVIRLYWKNKGQSFYTGLLAFVREILKKHNIEYISLDERICPEQNLPDLNFMPPSGFEERPYQEVTVNRSMNFTRGIWSICTGAGKTMILAQTLGRIKTYPFIFYVLTKDLMEQGYDVLSSCFNEPIGRIGDGLADIKKINICTVQTAIRAINSDNSKFKISDYQFDDEDQWDEKSIEGSEKSENIRNLIRMAKGIYFDECVTGDTEVVTEKGKTRIDKILENNCRFVQTYDGNKVIYKPIIKWMDKGEKETIKIRLKNGSIIKCTKDHLIYTQKGWKPAGKIKINERILGMNVAADVESGFYEANMLKDKNMFLGIKLKNEQEKSGKKYIKSILENCRIVFVDVVKKLLQDIRRWINSSTVEVTKADTENMSLGTINSHHGRSIILSQRQKRDKLYWEPALEILPFFCQINDQKIIELQPIMGLGNLSGLTIKHPFWLDMVLRSKLKTIPDMARHGHGCIQFVCHLLRKLRNYYTKINLKKLLMMFCSKLATSDLHGGFVMTEADRKNTYLFTRKGGQKEKIISLKNGLTTRAIRAKYLVIRKTIKNIIIFYFLKIRQLNYLRKLNRSCQNACVTNWCQIRNITNSQKQKVYDIEVEDTHCFFGNGLLVHNCHHVAAKTCKEVLSASENAYWRFGGSATPYRESGDEIMIQAMFGSKIVDISASYLIKKDYLVRPYIFFEPVDSAVDLHSYAKIYEHCIAKNDSLNNHVAKTANHLTSRGLSSLVLVQHFPQGDYLKDRIPGSEFVTSRMTSKKRKENIERLRKKEISCMIATSLADEGLDIPTLDAALLAGGGASATRVNQRIGRTLRKDKNAAKPKDKSIVVVYEHNARHLSKHAKKVRKILKRESEFKMINSKGSEFIFDEIDSVLGVENGSSSIFEV